MTPDAEDPGTSLKSRDSAFVEPNKESRSPMHSLGRSTFLKSSRAKLSSCTSTRDSLRPSVATIPIRSARRRSSAALKRYLSSELATAKRLCRISVFSARQLMRMGATALVGAGGKEVGASPGILVRECPAVICTW
jgi:hypothetical protein